jgi:hypothetical protein
MFVKSAFASLGFLLGMLLGSTAVRAGDLTPIPPTDPDAQKLYAELQQDWWRWMASLPADGHPLADATGENCDLGQMPPVWYLGGTYGEVVEDASPTKQIGYAERYCEIPEGQAIFFPILNIAANNIGVDPPDDDATLEFTASIVNLLASRHVRLKLDGVEVPNVAETYLSESEAFDLDYVEGSLLSDEVGTTRAAGAGYFCLLEPPSPGLHTLEFSGEYAFEEDVFGFEFEFELEVHYLLNIVPE